MAQTPRTITIEIEAKMPDQAASAPDRFISITRARCIARYRMHSTPGRPEELQTNHNALPAGAGVDPGRRTISLAYAGGEMRIRKHGGPNSRDWVEVRDFRLRDGWLDEVYEFLDDWLGYASPSNVPVTTRTPTLVNDLPPTISFGGPERPRPIRDNPQA